MEVADLPQRTRRHVLGLVDHQNGTQAVEDVDGLLGEGELGHAVRRTSAGDGSEDPGIRLLAPWSIRHVHPVDRDVDPREDELRTERLPYPWLAVDEDDPAIIEEMGDGDPDLA